MVPCTKASTLGFNDNDASVSVKFFGRHGVFHDSEIGKSANDRQNENARSELTQCIKSNLPIAASIEFNSSFNRFVIDVTMRCRSFSVGI